jgi:hypothetical protein
LSEDYLAIRVEQADALTYPTDLLVLKYAQNLYGVDSQVVARLRISADRLPVEGMHTLVESHGIAAQATLFIGVAPLERFSYREIREFAHRALMVAGAVRPKAREVGLTLHGTGFGLDESEAFESELAGIVDAVMSGSFPVGLRTVTFLELDGRRAARLRRVLDSLLPGSLLRTDRRRANAGQATAERLRSVGYDSDTKDHAFVAMPFDESFQDTFHYGIMPAVRQAGLICERIDELTFTGDVIPRMKERIDAARIVVADLTDANPNVYLEVGYAWGRKVPTVLICHHATELKFDVRGQRCLIYRSIRDLEQKLTNEIDGLRRADDVR